MKIYIETYGCTANKNDENIMRGLLERHHHKLVSQIADADLLILNTCTVIQTTEQRMLSRLRVFKQTQKPLIVTGCMAAAQPQLIHSITPHALFLPPRSIHHIIDLINGTQPVMTETPKPLMPKHYDSITTPITIAEGCALSCAYCITKIARGNLHSFPQKDILTDITTALRHGCKELYLTAQDTAAYGLDTHTNLGVLLTNITQLLHTFRVRVGMMNPSTLKKNLTPILTAFAHSAIYKFLHIPVQSGDNDILAKMNRKYTIDEFMDIVTTFRLHYPNITIATDIITGFPSETEDQFNNTIALLETLQPDITNITRFSARPQTPAKTMKYRIPTHIVKQRSQQLSQLCSTISLAQNQRLIGTKSTLLLNEHGKHKTTIGRTETNKPVVLHHHLPLGEFVNVAITDSTPTHLVGNLI
jgi:threonylcarbamoyladenosine tRNA methylthiotransferase CDKAL1